MPNLARASPERELEKLIRLYLKAETDIINEIGRLRSQGLVDYHAVAALERVQAILRKLENDSWEYVPRMIESQFYVRRPEARAQPGETVEKHRAAYLNAQSLTGTQTDIVQRLTMNLMGQLTDGGMTVLANLQSALIGRIEPDVYRAVGLEQVAAQQAVGRGINRSVPAFVDALRREGVTAFTDKAGRNWSLHTYATMVSRTTSRQAEMLSVLTADPEHDLYQISAHGTTCGLCAPYEGRVYSKSGKDPDFPPLSDAFGKVDAAGPDDLTNSWLNIHPNCLHALRRWTPAGRSPAELERIKRFSSPKTNPYSRDPRTKAQIEAYRKKEQGRAKWLRDYRQWEKYRTALGDKVPKTFATFQKHKQTGSEKYQGWVKAFREANAEQTGRTSLHDISMENIKATIKTVRSVKSFACDTLDKAAQNQLKNAHKRLLVEGSAQELGVEVGRVFDTSMRPLSKTVVGISGHIKLPDPDVPYVAVHTHPDCNILSPADLDGFTSRKNARMITAICHNGHVFAVEKTSRYDANIAKTFVSDLNESKSFLEKQYYNGEITGREFIESVDYLVRMCLDNLQGYGVKFYE